MITRWLIFGQSVEKKYLDKNRLSVLEKQDFSHIAEVQRVYSEDINSRASCHSVSLGPHRLTHHKCGHSVEEFLSELVSRVQSRYKRETSRIINHLW